MRTRRALNLPFIAFVPLAACALVGLSACNTGTSEVTPTNRPADGDGSHVAEQMAAANAPELERKAEAQAESAAGAAANRQLADAPPPQAQQVTPPAPEPKPETKTEAKTETKTATGPDAAAPASKPESRTEAKPEPKPAVTFLNSDTAPALSTKTLENGLVIEELKIGEGADAKSGAIVTINYHGTLKEGGTLVDSTRGKQPATYPLNKLIKGWQQGVPGMKPGGIRRLTIPYALAYGEAGKPPVIPPKSDLVFIIELIQVVEPSK